MLVKIGDKIYDSTQVPILLIFDAKEIKDMQNLADNNHKYCSCPDDTEEKDIVEFMRTDDVEIEITGYVRY